MKNCVKQYLRAVRNLFPVMSKPERAYLAHLKTSIQDYFGERQPATMEEIAAVFGSPEQVLGDYLDQAEPEYLLRRVKLARRWRVLTWVMVVALVLAAVFCTWHIWQDYQDYLRYVSDMTGYWVEVIE
ncbi:MAG: DUF6120 family protein [Clostridiales bacterium]|nr:DUF6120 family protein [Clostridiales bacterium]